MAKKTTRRLTSAIRLYLDLSWFLCWLTSIFVFPAALLFLLGFVAMDHAPKGAVPVSAHLVAEPYPEIPPNVTFEGDPGELPPFLMTTGPVEWGQGRFFVRSPSKAAWAIHFGMLQLTLCVWIYVTARLRGLFDALAEGQAFTAANALRVRKVGLAIVSWSVAAPLLKFLAGTVLLRGIEIERFSIGPSFDLNLAMTFSGLAIVVLAELFRQAGALEREQRLTV